LIGICGAHRTGKTTLADAYAQTEGIPFLKTAVSEVYRSIGIDPKADIPFGTRLAAQMVVLEALSGQYARAAKSGKVWITDRTPIDLAAYLLADVQRETCLEPSMSQAVMKYLDDCMALTNLHFGVLVLVQPGIPVVEAEGKARGEPAYQEHLNALMFGLMMDSRVMARPQYIAREVTDPLQRLLGLQKAVSSTIGHHQKMMELTGAVIH
jgi:predicted ATPase